MRCFLEKCWLKVCCSVLRGMFLRFASEERLFKRVCKSVNAECQNQAIFAVEEQPKTCHNPRLIKCFPSFK